MFSPLSYAHIASTLKLNLFIILCFYGQYIYAQQPIIHSFSPMYGPVGSQITIVGSNFNSTPSSNIVFVGSVRAVVAASTTTSLTVNVPAGSSYKPISVTTNGLTAYSKLSFTLSFSDGITINRYSLAPRVDSATGLHPNCVAVADLDGDGKPDLATANNFSTEGEPASVSLLRNTSQPGIVSFAPHQDIPTGVQTYAVAVRDLNGDGKPDLVSTSVADDMVSVFTNSSSVGNINFSQKTDYATNGAPYSVAIGDVDGDGKPDMVVANYYLSNTISVYRNTSSGAIISFSPKQDFMTSLSPRFVVINDIDGDGKADILVANELSNTISVFTNVSSVGNIALNNRVDYNTGNAPYSIAVSDLDADSKPDIVVSNYESATFSVFKNTSVAGSIGFLPATNYPTAGLPTSVSIGDINGDGKPDVIVTAISTTIAENKSTPGNIEFLPPVDMLVGANVYSRSSTSTADIDGDGKTDLIGTNVSFDHITVYKNKNNEPYVSDYTPPRGGAGDTITITGLNFQSTKAVSFGGTTAASFKILDGSNISAVVGLGSSGYLTVTNQYGKDSNWYPFEFTGPPLITSFSPSSAALGQTVKITGKNLGSPTSVKFGNILSSSYSATTDEIVAIVDTGATGDITVTTQYGSATKSGFVFLPLPTIKSFTPNKVGFDSTIVITGTNFTGASAVSIGGVSASSFVVYSATTISAVVGKASSGAVSVTTAYGTTSAEGFTFAEPPTIESFSPGGANPDEYVMVRGTNFEDVMRVSVGNHHPASYELFSPTELRVRIDYFSESGSIEVATRGGKASSPGFIFMPRPTITAINPDRAGPGTPVTITGTNLNNITEVRFGDSFAQSFISNSYSSLTAIVGNGSSGQVKATNMYGTGSSLIYGTENNGYFNFVLSPLIYSYSPASGSVGSLVTLKGCNFSAVSTGNQVYFGGVKTKVLSASDSTLSVLVPPSATNGQITVTTNGLVGYSNTPFQITFSDGKLNNNSFANKVDIDCGAVASQIKTADVDNDGKPDILVNRAPFDSLFIYRNISQGSNIGFELKYKLPSSGYITTFDAKDIDNDGRPEIIYNAYNSSYEPSIQVFKNNSDTINFSFDTATSVTEEVGAGITELSIFDFNMDGKPDIAWKDYQTNIIRYAVNNSVGHTFLFTWGAYSTLRASPNDVSVYDFGQMGLYDFNRDGQQDIFLGPAQGDTYNSFFTFLKTGSPASNGVPLFSKSVVDDIGAQYSSSCVVGDFDGDGNTDILTEKAIFAGMGGFNFNVLRPDSEIGGQWMLSGDLDGDGKLDFIRNILRPNGMPSVIAVARNTSAPGKFAFDTTIKINHTGGIGRRVIADLNNDGRPEIILSNTDYNGFTIFKNNSGKISLCPGGSTTLTAANLGLAYKWQVNSGGGFANITDGGSYIGTNTSMLQLSNIPSVWQKYTFRCLVDGKAGDPFGINFNNEWVGKINNQWENAANWSCGIVPDKNTDVIIRTGTVVIQSNVQIKSLSIYPEASFSVSNGASVTIVK